MKKRSSISDVCKSLDVSGPALRRCVMASKKPDNSENSRVKQLEAELKKMKKGNNDLKDTVEVFKKLIAILSYIQKNTNL